MIVTITHVNDDGTITLEDVEVPDQQAPAAIAQNTDNPTEPESQPGGANYDAPDSPVSDDKANELADNPPGENPHVSQDIIDINRRIAAGKTLTPAEEQAAKTWLEGSYGFYKRLQSEKEERKTERNDGEAESDTRYFKTKEDWEEAGKPSNSRIGDKPKNKEYEKPSPEVQERINDLAPYKRIGGYDLSEALEKLSPEQLNRYGFSVRAIEDAQKARDFRKASPELQFSAMRANPLNNIPDNAKFDRYEGGVFYYTVKTPKEPKAEREFDTSRRGILTRKNPITGEYEDYASVSFEPEDYLMTSSKPPVEEKLIKDIKTRLGNLEGNVENIRYTPERGEAWDKAREKAFTNAKANLKEIVETLKKISDKSELETKDLSGIADEYDRELNRLKTLLRRPEIERNSAQSQREVENIKQNLKGLQDEANDAYQKLLEKPAVGAVSAAIPAAIVEPTPLGELALIVAMGGVSIYSAWQTAQGIKSQSNVVAAAKKVEKETGKPLTAEDVSEFTIVPDNIGRGITVTPLPSEHGGYRAGPYGGEIRDPQTGQWRAMSPDEIKKQLEADNATQERLKQRQGKSKESPSDSREKTSIETFPVEDVPPPVKEGFTLKDFKPTIYQAQTGVNEGRNGIESAQKQAQQEAKDVSRKLVPAEVINQVDRPWTQYLRDVDRRRELARLEDLQDTLAQQYRDAEEAKDDDAAQIATLTREFQQTAGKALEEDELEWRQSRQKSVVSQKKLQAQMTEIKQAQAFVEKNLEYLRTIDKYNSQIRDLTATLNKVGTQTKLSQKAQEQIQEQIKELTKQQTKAQQATRTQTATRTQEATRTKEAEETRTQEATRAGEATRTGEMTRTGELTRTAEMTDTGTLTGRLPLIVIEKSDKEKRKAILRANGAVGWRQGELNGVDRWDVIVSPYTSREDYVIVFGDKPKGAYIVKGPGSARRTAQILYGQRLRKPVRFDTPGAFNVHLTPSGERNVKLEFNRDADIAQKTPQVTSARVFPLRQG